nr:casp-like protein 4a2 [Quercus suber]
MKKSSSKNSDSSAHYNDLPHSPLQFHSPLRSELGDPLETPPYHSPKASPEKPPSSPLTSTLSVPVVPPRNGVTNSHQEHWRRGGLASQAAQLEQYTVY